METKNNNYIAQATYAKIWDMAYSFFDHNAQQKANNVISDFCVDKKIGYLVKIESFDYDRNYAVVKMYDARMPEIMIFLGEKTEYAAPTATNTTSCNIYGFVDDFVLEMKEKCGDSIYDKRFKGYYRQTGKMLRKKYRTMLDDHRVGAQDKKMIEMFGKYITEKEVTL